MDTGLLIKIILLPFSVFAPGIFAGSETALMSLSTSQLNALKERASTPARKEMFIFWENNPDRVLAAIILGNTLFTVIAGVLSASIGKDIAETLELPGKWVIPLLSFFVTCLVLVCGEILPKILGRLHSVTIARWVILPLILFTRASTPVIHFLVRVAGIFVRILGAEPSTEIPTLTAQDLQGMLGSELSAEPNIVPRRILKNILDFGSLRVNEVQKERGAVIAVDITQATPEVIKRISRLPYSRIPVYRGSLDNIIGIIYSKDLLTAWRTQGLLLIYDLIRPVYFVNNLTPVLSLLREFKKGRHHFAVVRNEEQKVTGIITIEDILEEITGEIYDESKTY